MTQAEALTLLKLGQNVFLTGAAGAGKTYVLNQYIEHLREWGVGVAITASTGIAATHLGGQTIHSWSGIGIKDSFTESDFERLSKRKKLVDIIRDTKVLVIDEVSMLHAHQLDMIDSVLRQVKDFTKPFGGVQMILSGDFFQLPPVSRGREAQFVFEAESWRAGEFVVCYLTEQHRQKQDPLLGILNDIRDGKAGEHTKIPLRTRYKQKPAGETPPTKLFTHNTDVDRINENRLRELDEEEQGFAMITRGTKKLVEAMKAACLAPEYLRLKKGASVMFVKNHPEGDYVNGTLGTVVSFDQKGGNPIVKTTAGELIYVDYDEWRLEEEGEIKAALVQYPLRLAWAITVHKSQGMTLDAAEMDLSKAFEPGMGYVALSRVRSLNGLCLVGGGLNQVSLQVNQRVLDYDATLRSLSQDATEMLSALDQTAITNEHEGVLHERFGAPKDKRRVKEVSEAKREALKKPKISTQQATREMIVAGETPEAIAKKRGLKLSTIYGHLDWLKERGELPNIDNLRPPEDRLQEILDAFHEMEDQKLSPVHEALDGKYTYEEIRLARLFL